MSQQINSRAVVKLTQWPTKGYAPVTCVMILNDNVKLKTIMDNDDTQANYKKTIMAQKCVDGLSLGADNISSYKE